MRVITTAIKILLGFIDLLTLGIGGVGLMKYHGFPAHRCRWGTSKVIEWDGN